MKDTNFTEPGLGCPHLCYDCDRQTYCWNSDLNEIKDKSTNTMDRTKTAEGNDLALGKTAESQVPESFKALCRMIMKQSVTYAEAWEIVQDIVAADTKIGFNPFHHPTTPF